MMIRTDLAVEAHKIAAKAGEIDGVTREEEQNDGVTVTRVHVLNEQGKKAIGKPIGTYVTVETEDIGSAGDDYSIAVDAIAREIAAMLAPIGSGLVLVAGLGNDVMTPDALGPRCVRNVLVTRHIAGELTGIAGLEGLRAVAAVSPGVLGQTGVETGEIIKAVVQSISPSAVIAVDALASRSASRLGNTVQIADTGITPGSGVGNARFAVTRESLNVPVISIGVPTVVDAVTLAIDVLEQSGIAAGQQEEDKIRACVQPGGISLFVTPRSVDMLVEHAAKLVGKAINKALHPGVPVEEMMKLVG